MWINHAVKDPPGYHHIFERVCQLNLEGIVAKYKFGPYGGGDSLGTWYKIRNRNYSQMVGREKLFERDRHKEPVPGWHCCELACAGVDVKLNT